MVSPLFAEQTKTVFNPHTGSPDFITALSTSSIKAGTGITVSTTSSGVVIAAGGGGGSSGIVSPGTFTWTNGFGINASTIVVSQAAAGAAKAVPTGWVPPVSFRSNISTDVGFLFKVPTPITITMFGRYYHAGNTMDHVMYLWQTNTLLSSATVLAATASDSQGFKYVNLPAPITLSPGVSYGIGIDETLGGDDWPDNWNSAFVPHLINLEAAYAAGGNGAPLDNHSPTFTTFDAPSFEFTSNAIPATAILRGPDSSSSTLVLNVNDNTNLSLLNIQDNGLVTVGYSATVDTSTKFQIVAPDPTVKPLVIQGASSQGADMTEWQNGMGSNYAKIDSQGNLFLNEGNTNSSIYLGSYPSDPTNYAGLWLSAATPSATNYSFLANNTGALFNAPLALNFRLANSDQMTITSSLVHVAPVLQEVSIVQSVYFADYDNTKAYFASSLAGSGGWGWLLSNRIADQVPFAVRGAGSQTSNLMEWLDSFDVPLSVVNSVGWVGISTGTPQAALDVQGGAIFKDAVSISSATIYTGTTFSTLGAPANGTIRYCSDCTVTTPATCTANLLASCVCAASGNGAFAKRINGSWYCN